MLAVFLNVAGRRYIIRREMTVAGVTFHLDNRAHFVERIQPMLKLGPAVFFDFIATAEQRYGVPVFLIRLPPDLSEFSALNCLIFLQDS